MNLEILNGLCCSELECGCEDGTDYLSMVGMVLGPSAPPMRRDHYTQLQRGCQGDGDLEAGRAASKAEAVGVG